MDELLNQWYPAGRLLVETGFLIAVVWSVRAMLRHMRASEEQMGALLKLLVSGGAGEESLRTTHRPTPYLMDGWPPVAADQVPVSAPNALPRKGVWSGVSDWLQGPMVGSGPGPWRRAVRWLQAPAGS